MPTLQQTQLLRSSHVPGENALLSDLFADTQNPLISGPANPGRGVRQITSTRLQTIGGRLRGSGQTSSPSWGATKDVYTRDDGTGFPRQGGLAFCTLMTVEDFNNRFAIGWDTATNTTDPRTVGHGFVNEAGSNAGGSAAIQPGAQVTVGSGIRNTRSMDYLVVVVLYAAGAVVLLSTFGADDTGDGMDGTVPIYAYPNARVLWVEGSDTTSPLYPYISYYDRTTVSYPNGHAIEHARVVNVQSWSAQDSIAAFADRFDRANSTTSIGGTGWTALTGTWGISSNQAYIQSEASPNAVVRQATGPSANGDGLYQFAVVIPASGNGNWLCCVRLQDATHFIYVTNGGNSNTLYLRSNNGGSVATINSTGAGISFANSTTYIISIRVMGATYQVYVNGALKLDWSTDSNAFFTSENRWGMAGVTGYNPNQAKFDYAWCYAHSVALPSEIAAGAVPYVAVPGSTILADTFADTDSTSLASHTPTTGGAWTANSGTWTIQSNRASVSLGGVIGLATQDAGTTDAEATLDIITPATFSTDWHAGIILRFTDTSNYMYVVALRTSLQVGADEVEFHEVIAGVDTVTHKQNLGSKFTTSTTYTLKVQAKGRKVYVFLDGKPRCSLVPSSTYPGTRWGIERSSFDTGCVFDNWVVKAL